MSKVSGFWEGATSFHVLADKLDEAADETDPAIDDAVETSAFAVRRKARRLVSVQSGRLKRSIQVRRLRDAHYMVGSDLDYAEWVEKGRGPVVAKNADALKFTIDGQTVFRQRVGPAAPRPFMRPALQLESEDLPDHIKDEIERVMGDVF
jgi:TRAP-type mannitol/chloroaromatic compound transport system substrate-binding protein